MLYGTEPEAFSLGALCFDGCLYRSCSNEQHLPCLLLKIGDFKLYHLPILKMKMLNLNITSKYNICLY